MTIRLAIINHATHTLFVEDVEESEIEAAGGEEEFILENYNVQKDEFSWDYIVDAEYIPNDDDKDPYEIDFENWCN